VAQLRLSNSDLTATIDDKHVAACAGRSWFLKKSSHCSYVASTVRVGGKTPTVRLHTFVYVLVHGSVPAGHDVHHIDADTMNNTSDNLQALERSVHNEFTFANKVR